MVRPEEPMVLIEWLKVRVPLASKTDLPMARNSIVPIARTVEGIKMGIVG